LSIKISGTNTLFSSTETEKLVGAIQILYDKTSALIHIHIDEVTEISILDRATEVFELLGGNLVIPEFQILIYFAAKEKQFVILGNNAISNRVGSDFWNETADNMTIYFKNGDFLKGVLEGIESSGKMIKANGK